MGSIVVGQVLFGIGTGKFEFFCRTPFSGIKAGDEICDSIKVKA